MNRTLIKYIGLFVALLILIIGLEWSKPKRIDWKDTSLSINSKKPFGLYVFNQQLAQLFLKNELHYATHFSNAYLDKWSRDSISKSGFLYINYIENISHETADTILKLADRGNTVFISSASFNYNLLDTLGVSIKEQVVPENNTFSVWTTNQNLSKGRFDLKRAFGNNYFQLYKDKISYEALGFQSTIQNSVPNFIKVPFGNGIIYLHIQPLAFSNYSLLESNNHLYVENILSYIQTEDIYWITKEKELKVSDSLLRYVLINPALKWGWYFFLISLVVFVFFTAKRKQRIIPIIPPIKNTSIDFVKTISGLYIDTKDYKGIMQKQIIQTQEEIRSKYRIDTRVLNSNFIDILELKSGIDRIHIENWVKLVNQIQTKNIPNEEVFLIKLNQATEKLWN